MKRFRDRREAGQQLAHALRSYAHDPNLLVLGLPRGGVPVAYEIAAALEAPLDIFVVRKLGVPGQEELAMGAIASGGIQVLNRDVIDYLRIPEAVISAVAAQQRWELNRREQAYRGDQRLPQIHGRTVIVVDDGMATGSSMRAAVAALKEHRPRRVIVAAPVAADSACEQLRQEADDVVCLLTPSRFDGVGGWYDDFTQTSDEEVRLLLRESRKETSSIPS